MLTINRKALASFVAVFVMAVAGLVFSGSSAEATNEGVCQPQSDHMYTGTEDSVWTYTAPDGFLVSGYCVKAGSIKQGNGPEYDTLPTPLPVVTIVHSSGKAISHYTITLVPVPPKEVCPEGTTGTPPNCVTPSATPTPTPTETPTVTPTPTETVTPTVTPSVTPSDTPTVTPPTVTPEVPSPTVPPEEIDDDGLFTDCVDGVWVTVTQGGEIFFTGEPCASIPPDIAGLVTDCVDGVWVTVAQDGEIFFTGETCASGGKGNGRDKDKPGVLMSQCLNGEPVITRDGKVVGGGGTCQEDTEPTPLIEEGL